MDEQRIEVLIPSRLDYLGVLAKMVEALQSPLELTDEETFALSTALIEAGTNAIQHGSGGGSLPVRLVLRGDAQRVVMDVQDHGKGFDLARAQSHVAEVTAPDHIFDSRGRGIFIMREVMDEVNFAFANGEGTTVTLVLRRKANGS
jgi:serine/threonine-protein kinase RsbW